MYTVAVKVEAKGQDGSDFDFDVVCTYRNVKTVEQVDMITKGVADGLFALGKMPAAPAGK